MAVKVSSPILLHVDHVARYKEMCIVCDSIPFQKYGRQMKDVVTDYRLLTTTDCLQQLQDFSVILSTYQHYKCLFNPFKQGTYYIHIAAKHFVQLLH